MITMQQEFTTPEEALAHFGIKGMRWGIRKERGKSFVEAQTFGQPYSLSNGLGHGSKIHDLKKPENLRVDSSKGYADIRPKNGFKTKRAEVFHNELTQGLDEMLKEYPALKDLKIEVVPMSHQKGMGFARWSGVPAAAAHLKEGEVRLFYNDTMRGKPNKPSKEALATQPGIAHPGFVGRHEMGHVLGMTSGGPMHSGWEVTHDPKKTWDDIDRDREVINTKHEALFKKHGLTFKELSNLSPYAATEPGEALAEVAGYYHTPALRAKMSPEMQKKAKAMLDDLGGKPE